METAAIVTVTFIVAFGLGFAFARAARNRRRAFSLNILVTGIAALTSLLALMGFIALISPSLAMGMMSNLPPNIQNILFVDLFLRGGTGFWAFLIISGLLWWFRTRI